MRTLLLIAALAFACKRDKAVVRADPDEKKHGKSSEVVIAKVPPRVGTRAHDTRTNATEFKVSIGIGTGTPTPTGFQRSEQDDRTEEILAVNGSAVTKLRVTYDLRESTDTTGGGTPVKKNLSVHGHTYVVESTGAAIAVTDSHGKPAPSDESSIVSDDYRILGKEDEIARALPDGPIHAGDKLPALAAAMRERLLGKTALHTVGDVDVHVEKATREAIVLRVKATFAMDGTPTMSLSMPLDGTVTLRVPDGSLAEYTFEGPMILGAGDAGVAITGSGSLSMTAKRTYF